MDGKKDKTGTRMDKEEERVSLILYSHPSALAVPLPRLRLLRFFAWIARILLQ